MFSKIFALVSKFGGLSIAGLGINTGNARETVGGLALTIATHLIDSVWNSQRGNHPTGGNPSKPEGEVLS